jgi:hypothetical protein
MDVSNAFQRLKEHAEKHSQEKYYRSDINMDGMLKRPDFTVGSAAKYLIRYVAVDGEKRMQLDDLLKAAHNILFEIERRLTDQKFTVTVEDAPLSNYCKFIRAVKDMGFLEKPDYNSVGENFFIYTRRAGVNLQVFEREAWVLTAGSFTEAGTGFTQQSIDRLKAALKI